MMQELARERGGVCLSDAYTNATTKLRWRCAKGHEWMAVPDSVRNLGTWCPTCAGTQLLTIETMRSLASERGGRCLSKIYTNNRTSLHWECGERHRWEAKPANVLRGTWCPTCGSGMGERVCREVFEQVFGQPFPSSHPGWLRAANGQILELDGYCEPLKLAFEHQGAHHYGHSPFSKNRNELPAQQRRDRLKAARCLAKGVALVLIPEIPRLLPYREVRHFILLECQRIGVEVPSDAATRPLNLAQAYSVPDSKRAFAQLVEVVALKGGVALSKQYKGLYEKLRWRCENGHTWLANPADIKAGNWCPYCAGQRKTIHDMRAMAKERGGVCLSAQYRGMVHHKLSWRCAKGHEWMATPVSVSIGHWCPTCGGSKPLNIEAMRLAAQRKGGECLSTSYMNCKTKLRWRCAEGHEWFAVPSSVSAGTWCPICGVKKRVKNRVGKTAPLTIEKVRHFAAKRGGECLSPIFTDIQTHMTWRCAKGHTWRAAYSNLRNGSWCRICAKETRKLSR